MNDEKLTVVPIDLKKPERDTLAKIGIRIFKQVGTSNYFAEDFSAVSAKEKKPTRNKITRTFIPGDSLIALTSVRPKFRSGNGKQNATASAYTAARDILRQKKNSKGMERDTLEAEICKRTGLPKEQVKNTIPRLLRDPYNALAIVEN